MKRALRLIAILAVLLPTVALGKETADIGPTCGFVSKTDLDTSIAIVKHNIDKPGAGQEELALFVSEKEKERKAFTINRSVRAAILEDDRAKGYVRVRLLNYPYHVLWIRNDSVRNRH